MAIDRRAKETGRTTRPESSSILETPDDSIRYVDITSPISQGDTTVSVADSSPFSAGDDVRIRDLEQVYRGTTDLSTGGDATCGNRTVTDGNNHVQPLPATPS